MQQSDYILREIEKISIMLMGMIGKMIKRKKEGIELNEGEYSSISNEILEDANFDLEKLLQTKVSEFDVFFKSQEGFDQKNIEILADLIASMADISRDENKKTLLQKAHEIYIYLDKTSKTLSFERMAKLKNIEDILTSNE